MYKLTSIQTRPSTSVDFWMPENPAVLNGYLDHFRSTYVVTGKLLDVNSTVSANGLELTTDIIWDGEESANTWKQDARTVSEFVAPRDAYFASAGITTVFNGETI